MWICSFMLSRKFYSQICVSLSQMEDSPQADGINVKLNFTLFLNRSAFLSVNILQLFTT